MSSNPRRGPMTRPGSGLSLKTTNMVLRKGATFHSPISPTSTSDSITFVPPPLPRRSQTNLDDVVDAHRRRVALTLGDIDKTLSAASGQTSSSTPRKSFRDDSLPIPRGLLNPGLLSKDMEVERRVLRPRPQRRLSGHNHESDSGLGTSIASTNEKRALETDSRSNKTSVSAAAVTRSAAASTSENFPGLSARSTNRIIEHILKPLLSKPALKEFHPVVLECPSKIQSKEIVCLRDLEKTLLLTAEDRTKVAKLYLDFCLTTIRCIQATVEYLPEREQRKPTDLAYTSGYFIDLIDQIRQYAQQLADAKEKKTLGETDTMDVDASDEVKLHGGIAINGRPAELVRVRDGKAISMATGEAIELLEGEGKSPIRFKRSASQELEDDDEIMRSMARRKKNAPPEEYAPKKCREPGCNKEFKRPCDLTKHEKTHSRPWKCTIPTCKYHEYGWPTEKELDRHHNDKHSSAPKMYECLYKPCPYKSKRESNCKQHMEKAHGWQYVRTKTNGKKDSKAGSVTQATPQLHNLPTPTSDHSFGVATPPQDFNRLYNSSIEFPAYDQFNGVVDLPQEIQLDYSPVDNATPSTDGGLDSFQDMDGDFTLFDDIYNAHAQLPAPMISKEMAQSFAAFSAAELYKTHPAPHLSPTGQGNADAMLFTPSSLAEVDEGFDDYQAGNVHAVGPDFCLFPNPGLTKPMVYEPLFGEMPSVAAGYSQPTSQELLPDWRNTEYHGFSQ